MPLLQDPRYRCFLFDGNYCSWNCVKAYYLSRRMAHRKEDKLILISLLAYITVHRPKYCPSHPWYPHPCDCPCILKPFHIRPAPPPTCLQLFGGKTNIEEYRKDFLTIQDYTHVDRYFKRNPRVTEKEYKFLLYKTIKPLPSKTVPDPPKIMSTKKRYG